MQQYLRKMRVAVAEEQDKKETAVEHKAEEEGQAMLRRRRQ